MPLSLLLGLLRTWTVLDLSCNRNLIPSKEMIEKLFILFGINLWITLACLVIFNFHISNLCQFNLLTFLLLRNLTGGKHADKRRGWRSRSHHLAVPEGQLWPLGDSRTFKTSTLPQQHRTGSGQRRKTTGPSPVHSHFSYLLSYWLLSYWSNFLD